MSFLTRSKGKVPPEQSHRPFPKSHRSEQFPCRERLLVDRSDVQLRIGVPVARRLKAGQRARTRTRLHNRITDAPTEASEMKKSELLRAIQMKFSAQSFYGHEQGTQDGSDRVLIVRASFWYRRTI
jgi:hypothetical protein